MEQKSMYPVPLQALEFMSKIGSRLAVPIFQGLQQNGTGFFISTATHQYLVTAAHVLAESQSKWFLDRGVDARLFCYVSEKRIMPLHGFQCLVTASSTGGADLYDVGVVQLPRLIEWSADLEPLTVPFTTISKVPLLRPELHAMCGFPANRTKVDRAASYFETHPVGLAEVSLPAARYSALGLSFKEHIVLPLNHKRLHSFSDGHRHLPKLAGMSGTPIFSLVSRNGELRPSLRGVFTRHRSNDRILVGCRMTHVLTMIDQMEVQARATH